MDRLVDRAFNKAHGTAHAVMGTANAAAQQREKDKQQQKSRESMLRELTTPMTAADVVERIGLAHQDHDFFRQSLCLVSDPFESDDSAAVC
jgi:hypothetical protein